MTKQCTYQPGTRVAVLLNHGHNSPLTAVVVSPGHRDPPGPEYEWVKYDLPESIVGDIHHKWLRLMTGEEKNDSS